MFLPSIGAAIAGYAVATGRLGVPASSPPHALFPVGRHLPGVMEALKGPSPDAFPLEIRVAYLKVAPDPQQWATLVYKSAEMTRDPSTAGFLTVDQLATVAAPALVIVGHDDFIDADYARDMAGMLKTALLVLPGDHSSYLTSDPQVLLKLIAPFYEMA